MSVNFMEVTEVVGEEVSNEQLQRLCNRYYWAGQYCKNKRVLEVACGTGQGLGYLSTLASNLSAGDISQEMCNIARNTYANSNIDIQTFAAEQLPFSDHSQDIIVCCEAIYYISNIHKFFSECRRVLSNNGKLLIVTANPDLYDFNPSPYSYGYYGVRELTSICSSNGFTANIYGDFPVTSVSFKQRLLRPIKKIVVALNLMPKTMQGKKLLKKLVFGKLIAMPKTINAEMMSQVTYPKKLNTEFPDRNHKVLFCEAEITK